MSNVSHSLRHLLGFAGFSSCLIALAASAQASPATQPTAVAAVAPAPASPLDFKVITIDGKEANLADYKGKVVLIVNVASRCGFTSQYAGLQKMYEKYQGKGFVILAFPANNFKNQEPGTNEQIKAFAASKYHVTFPMMAKISVAGDDKAALYAYLTAKETGGNFAGEIEWNFTKLLVGRGGAVVARFPSKIKPEDPKVIVAIEEALAAPEPSRRDQK
jgi:glutathione peroxidase